jgi:hypothetical protein
MFEEVSPRLRDGCAQTYATAGLQHLRDDARLSREPRSLRQHFCQMGVAGSSAKAWTPACNRIAIERQ